MQHSDLKNMPALVLNADYRPLSYNPLSLWDWQDTIKAVAENRVDVVDTYDRVVRSPSREMLLPSVVALRAYVTSKSFVRFTRFNIFLRDNFTCLYCGVRDSNQLLTFEHVIPRSRGGDTSWENIATACMPCNNQKRDRTPEEAGMKLLYEPFEPKMDQLRRPNRMMHQKLHQSWVDFIYWDSELDRS